MVNCTTALLTCGPRLSEVQDFLSCYEKGIFKYRIHLGKTNRDNIKIIKNLLETQKIINDKIDIYIDIPTTRPRLGKNLTNINKVTLQKGEKFNILFTDVPFWQSNMVKHENNMLITNFEKHKKLIKEGEHVEFKDGSYSGIVSQINNYGMEIFCTSKVQLCESESVVFPDNQLEYEIFDPKTKLVLQQIKDMGIIIDKFIISFCSTKEIVDYARQYLKEFFGYDVIIMAKIEDSYGIKNINEIALYSDEIMIGRGDLGAAIGFSNLPRVQEQLVYKVRRLGKPVYVATQFLEELAQKDRICSPELNDIFLAINQGANGVMLSGEVGGSPNSPKCREVLCQMINQYKNMEVNMTNNLKNHTQILATMGPTLQSVDDAINMINLGVHQFRIHMGLRTRDFCGYYRNAMIASKQLLQEISVLLDLPSTRPRVVNMEEYVFKSGEYAYIFDSAYKVHAENNYTNIPLPNFSDIIQYVNVGEHIMFRDGHVVFEIKEKHERSVLVKCIKSDLLIKTGASSCFPESDVIFEPIDEIDISYLNKMKAEGMCPDKVAISFASTVEQINSVKKVLNKIWADNNIQIICKIESKLGLKNIDDLIMHSDGIMIARGDLLLCINPFEMPKIQMELADKCLAAGKNLIIATEFFERYAESGIVNRAELSDVALAVRQGANSIMLARETGNSNYSLGCVKLINEIIENEIKQ